MKDLLLYSLLACAALGAIYLFVVIAAFGVGYSII